MRLALCQINPTIGDLEGNCRKIASWADQAAKQGARIAVFPELAVCGYPPRDLLDRPQFVKDSMQAMVSLAAQLPSNLYTIVGGIYQPEASGLRPYNSAAIIHANTIERWIHKRLLPTYDVFDEHRYFIPAESQAPFQIDGCSLGITLCEDAWNDVSVQGLTGRYTTNPIADLITQGVDVLINLSASPFAVSKLHPRTEMFATIAKRHTKPLVFVNQVGGNDDLIFDGHSAVFGPDGSLWHLATPFSEDMVLTELKPTHASISLLEDDVAIKEALILGTQDYAHKCGFQRAVLGLSGGIDSALCAAIAAEALGPHNVLGVSMSTRYNSEQSVSDAIALANNLGIQWQHIDIDPVYIAYEKLLEPVFQQISNGTHGHATFENVQSRIRGATLMAISNRFGHLLLSTGNKSEIAMGYCTLYGDMAGGLAVLSDLPKTVVYRIVNVFNKQAGYSLIPDAIIQKPPSAELRPNQKDTDTLPPYDVLDPILEDFIENDLSAEAIIHKGFDASTVYEILHAVRRNEYKRRQMPPGLIVTRKAFGPGRRYPIAQAYKT